MVACPRDGICQEMVDLEEILLTLLVIIGTLARPSGVP